MGCFDSYGPRDRASRRLHRSYGMSIIAASKASRLGTKRTCRSCGARFYDFDKPKPACPKCQAIFDVDAEPVLPALEPLSDEETAVDAELELERQGRKKARHDDEDSEAERDALDD
jgi:hypothetical protein